MGKSSMNVQPVKGGSEVHNRRTKKLDYVREDLSHKNESWEQDSISNVLAQAKERAKEKTGRKMQQKATPIREGVFLFEEHHTMDDVKKLSAKIEARFGIRTFQIHMHRDEGHVDKETKKWKPNLHGHLVFDWTDHETGKSIKMNRPDMVELQTMVANELGMERGVASDKKHLTSQQFKIEAELKQLAQELKTSNKAREELQTIEAMLREPLGELIAYKRNMVGLKVRDKEQTISNIQQLLLQHQKLKQGYKNLMLQKSNSEIGFKNREKMSEQNSLAWREKYLKVEGELQALLKLNLEGKRLDPEQTKQRLGGKISPNQGKDLGG